MQISDRFRNYTILCVISVGAFSTISYNVQNSQIVYQGSYYKLFHHPFMQTFTMFFGQFLCLIIFYIVKYYDPSQFQIRMKEAQNKGKQIQFNHFWFAFSAALDFVSSTILYLTTNFISNTIIEIYRGGTLLFTCLFSIFYLKIKFQKAHYCGMICSILGIILVILSNMLFPAISDLQSRYLQNQYNIQWYQQIIGFIFLIISMLLASYYIIFQQKLFTKYHLQPFQVIGFQGLFGLIYCIIFLPIFNYIHCPYRSNFCVLDSQSFPYLQKPLIFFSQIHQNTTLLSFIILGIIFIGLLNVCQATITKYINGLAQVIADTTRVLIIWIIGIIVSQTAGSSYPNYVWQSLRIESICLKIIGFIFLIFANITYNRIITLCFQSSSQQLSSLYGKFSQSDTQDKYYIS